MATASQIEARIAKLRQQLRDKKRQEKQREAEQILSVVKRSGLTLLDIKNLIESRAGGGEK